MGNNEIIKRSSSSLKEKAQYGVAFSLIGVMLYVAGFPIFFLLFVGVLTYFIWKVFSSESKNDIRRIFEFYLAANEILREQQRPWYGFEIHDTISRGEKIVKGMPFAPPLVHYALGALYDRLGDHSSAIRHLTYISEDAGSEGSIVFPTNELREYVRILRTIERSPGEAPQTSAAIRSLERARRNKAASLLEKNQQALGVQDPEEEMQQRMLNSVVEGQQEPGPDNVYDENSFEMPPSKIHDENSSKEKLSQEEKTTKEDPHPPERKTISEVLHDIYGESVR